MTLKIYLDFIIICVYMYDRRLPSALFTDTASKMTLQEGMPMVSRTLPTPINHITGYLGKQIVTPIPYGYEIMAMRLIYEKSDSDLGDGLPAVLSLI